MGKLDDLVAQWTLSAEVDLFLRADVPASQRENAAVIVGRRILGAIRQVLEMTPAEREELRAELAAAEAEVESE